MYDFIDAKGTGKISYGKIFLNRNKIKKKIRADRILNISTG
jgi:hypothetical protein